MLCSHDAALEKPGAPLAGGVYPDPVPTSVFVRTISTSLVPLRRRANRFFSSPSSR
jgi:hypothetical protein